MQAVLLRRVSSVDTAHCCRRDWCGMVYQHRKGPGNRCTVAFYATLLDQDHAEGWEQCTSRTESRESATKKAQISDVTSPQPFVETKLCLTNVSFRQEPGAQSQLGVPVPYRTQQSRACPNAVSQVSVTKKDSASRCSWIPLVAAD